MAGGAPGLLGGHMSRKYFGTDGIRGRANGLITPELALKVGQAAGVVFRRGEHRHRVVVGKDTRRSGYMIEYAMVAGFTSVGMDVLLLGPMPTPAVAMLAALEHQPGRLPHLERELRRDQTIGAAPNPVGTEIFAAHVTPSIAATSPTKPARNANARHPWRARGL